MIFNGYDFKDSLVVEGIDRSVLPSITNRQVTVPGRAGSIFSGTTVGINKIIVRCRVIGLNKISIQEQFRALAGKLYSNKPEKLKLSDEPTKYNIAKVSSEMSIEKFLNTGYIEIEFDLYEPFAYSEVEHTVTLGTTFNNVGTTPSYGVLNFKAKAGSSVKITSGTSNLTLLFPFAGTEQMVVDLNKNLITMNGNNAMKYLSFDSDFFVILPGTNKITVDGTGTLKYRNRWL